MDDDSGRRRGGVGREGTDRAEDAAGQDGDGTGKSRKKGDGAIEDKENERWRF